MRHVRSICAVLAFVTGCTHRVPAPPPVPSSTAARAIAVYRAIAESLYVTTTKRVIAVAATSLDSTCDGARCGDLAARWGVETLWWASGDSSEARSSRADLLSRATRPFDISPVVRGRSMLLEADAGDIPAADADVNAWIRFRSTHADAAGAVRMSPVGFSESGRTAVAFVDWRCGPTCGHTLGVALVATTDSTWSISEMLLVSSRSR